MEEKTSASSEVAGHVGGCNQIYLENFEGCDWLNDGELDARVKAMGMKYSYGKRCGVGGKERWMIEGDSPSSRCISRQRSLTEKGADNNYYK